MRSEKEINAQIKRLEDRVDRYSEIAVAVLRKGMNDNDITKEGKWSSREDVFARKVYSWMAGTSENLPV